MQASRAAPVALLPHAWRQVRKSSFAVDRQLRTAARQLTALAPAPQLSAQGGSTARHASRAAARSIVLVFTQPGAGSRRQCARHAATARFAAARHALRAAGHAMAAASRGNATSIAVANSTAIAIRNVERVFGEIDASTGQRRSGA